MAGRAAGPTSGDLPVGASRRRPAEQVERRRRAPSPATVATTRRRERAPATLEGSTPGGSGPARPYVAFAASARLRSVRICETVPIGPPAPCSTVLVSPMPSVPKDTVVSKPSHSPLGSA